MVSLMGAGHYASDRMLEGVISSDLAVEDHIPDPVTWMYSIHRLWD